MSLVKLLTIYDSGVSPDIYRQSCQGPTPKPETFLFPLKLCVTMNHSCAYMIGGGHGTIPFNIQARVLSTLYPSRVPVSSLPAPIIEGLGDKMRIRNPRGHPVRTSICPGGARGRWGKNKNNTTSTFWLSHVIGFERKICLPRGHDSHRWRHITSKHPVLRRNAQNDVTDDLLWSRDCSGGRAMRHSRFFLGWFIFSMFLQQIPKFIRLAEPPIVFLNTHILYYPLLFFSIVADIIIVCVGIVCIVARGVVKLLVAYLCKERIHSLACSPFLQFMHSLNNRY